MRSPSAHRSILFTLAAAVAAAVPSTLFAQSPGTYVPGPSRPEAGEPSRGPAPMFHGGHAGYSRYLIDPLFTHHAILEDELRVSGFADSPREGGTVWRTSVEVAYAFTDAFGAEIFVPFARRGSPEGDISGIEDLEVQPLKWSFLRRENLVMTGVLGAIVPVGDEDEGLGGGKWAVEPHLFMDAVLDRVAVQVNAVYGFVEGGEQEFEFSTSLARMVFLDESRSLGPLLEVMGTLVTAGDESGEWEALAVAPGAKLQLGGWHFGSGVRLPLLDRDPSDSVVVLTGGYHVSF